MRNYYNLNQGVHQNPSNNFIFPLSQSSWAERIAKTYKFIAQAVTRIKVKKWIIDTALSNASECYVHPL